MAFINFFVGKWNLKYQKEFMSKKDIRIKQSNEVFSQIKFIKTNCWEEFFYDKLDYKRNQEVSMIRTIQNIQSILIIFSWTTPYFALNATLLWLVGADSLGNFYLFIFPLFIFFRNYKYKYTLFF
jgi:hypothetical protein